MKQSKVLIVEPHKVPYERIIDSSLESWQEIVGGCIECFYPFNDTAFIVCNEEGKLRNLEGNRKIFSDIIAGTFLITQTDAEGDSIDLTDKQIATYTERFVEDEIYTQEEVEDSMFIDFL